LLAEISDKMETVGEVAVCGVIASVITCSAGVYRWWLAVPGALAMLLGLYTRWDELREPGIGDAIRSELGWSWIIGTSLAWTLPFVAALAATTWLRRYRASVRRNREGCCVECGHNLTGNVSGRCPECGEAIAFPRSAR
jgi:hypothetical protein